MNEVEMHVCANLWQATFIESFRMSGDNAASIASADNAVDALRAKVFGTETPKAPNPLKAVQ